MIIVIRYVVYRKTMLIILYIRARVHAHAHILRAYIVGIFHRQEGVKVFGFTPMVHGGMRVYGYMYTCIQIMIYKYNNYSIINNIKV